MPTYGNNGNRWWIGQNVGETGSNQTIFGTASIAAVNPFTPSGYESLPSGNAADDAKFAAAASHNKTAAKPETISVENIQWYNIRGPYTSQSAANAAIPAIQKGSPAQGIAGQTAQNNQGNPLGSAASAISSVQGFLSAFGDKNLWIRVAKVVVGGSILLVGVAKLTGFEKEVRKVGTTALKATPAGWIGAATHHGKSR